MSVVDALLWSLIVIPVFSWLAAGILVYKALRKPYIVALVERAFVGLLTSIASTVIAFLVLNSRLHWFVLDPAWSLALVSAALFVLELPALIWFVLYVIVWHDRPDNDDDGRRFGHQHRLDEQDREVGDKRRELQARDAEDER